MAAVSGDLEQNFEDRFNSFCFRLQLSPVVDAGRQAGLFLSGEAMIKYLLKMYAKAGDGDLIWAHCVRCAAFSPAVRKKIRKAAGQGVRFRMLINQHAPAVEECHTLFDPIAARGGCRSTGQCDFASRFV